MGKKKKKKNFFIFLFFFLTFTVSQVPNVPALDIHSQITVRFVERVKGSKNGANDSGGTRARDMAQGSGIR